MTTVRPLSVPGLLVVEGQTDQNAIFHLCRQANPGLEEVFNIHDAKSFQGLLNTIRGFVNQEGIPSIGFIVDADDEPIEHWRLVLDRIANANGEIILPASPDPDGTIITANPNTGSPRIGIWVMPDNSTTGELEDFVAQMIPLADPVWPLAQSYIDGIPRPRRFDDDKVPKAEVHAWLAARRFPGLVGLAIREGDLSVNNPLSQRFLTWLSRLFR